MRQWDISCELTDIGVFKDNTCQQNCNTLFKYLISYDSSYLLIQPKGFPNQRSESDTYVKATIQNAFLYHVWGLIILRNIRFLCALCSSEFSLKTTNFNRKYLVRKITEIHFDSLGEYKYSS